MPNAELDCGIGNALLISITFVLAISVVIYLKSYPISETLETYLDKNT